VQRRPGHLSTMVAGVAAGYDMLGSETADLLYNSWPRRPGERVDQPLGREFNTTGTNYGVGVHCHAVQTYREPDFAAGKSKRISASYQKTGVLSHRAEEGFRDTKGAAMLTEVPMGQDYGTMRQSLRQSRHLPISGSMVLHGLPREVPRISSDARSVRSGASNASRRSQGSQRSQGGASQGGASRRSQTSGASRVSRASHTSQAPSWFEERGSAWNFEPLPMYERTNETYGKANRSNIRTLASSPGPAAGKSESGWLEPNQLIATLTRPHPSGMQM
jgi:hypothetical protein